LGLMAALDLEEDRAQELVEAALSRGLIVNATGPKTIRLVPPLIVKQQEIEEAVSILDSCLASL
nr:aminotransferase class III-fold pyridoxal phosphate-dependent enzyme [Dehalococcoidales bacterium]